MSKSNLLTLLLGYARFGRTFWPKGRICDCPATGGPDAVWFT